MVDPKDTSIFRTTLSNPFAVTVTSYVSGLRPGKVKTPAEFVVTSRIVPLAIDFATTFAPTTTAPVGSVTVPVTCPVSVCPKAT
jgi:hypothetical protein